MLTNHHVTSWILCFETTNRTCDIYCSIDQYCIGHLQAILTHIQFLYRGASTLLCGCIQISSQIYFWKYTKCCFTFQTNPVTYLVMPHQCEKANYCPHTVFNLIDCRGFVMIVPNIVPLSEITCRKSGNASSWLYGPLGRMCAILMLSQPSQQMDSCWKLIDDGWVSYIISTEWVPTISCIMGQITLLFLYSGWLEPADSGARYVQKPCYPYLFSSAIQVACVNPPFLMFKIT